jgi:hypothetical protein
MKTSGSSFELIMQEVLDQKQIMEDLQAENDELKRQLAELSAGRGIFVEILGKRYPLVGEPVRVSPEEVPAAEVDLSLQETTAIKSENLSPPLAETPLPTTELTVEEAAEDQRSLASPATPSFLEEALLDEFSAANTRQIAVWSGPITNHPTFDEEEKETLRRELSGSFLLE